MHPFKSLFAAVALLATANTASAKSPGLDAIKEFRDGQSRPGAIENRFFLKKERFELAPHFGYVPNNPFAKRMVGGIGFAYHFSEQFAVEGDVSYSPDLGINDLKGLTKTLVVIAADGAGSDEFVQPLDKVTLAAGFGARWTPLYGKIALFGETVLNLDLYGVAGLGIVSKVNYVAVLNDAFEDDPANQPPAILERIDNEVKFTPILGIGTNIFLTQSVALKLDARMQLYVDNVADYQPSEDDPTDDDQQLYNNLVVSAGVAIYFPKMKPRISNF